MSSLLTAAVELKPDLAKFKKDLTAGVTDATKDAGKTLDKGVGDAGAKAGKRAGDEIGKGVEKGATEGAKKAGRQVETEMEKAGKAASSKFAMSWDRVNSLGNQLTLGVTLPAVAASKLALDAFSRYQDASAAAGVFYGEQAKAIEQFGQSAAKNFGISRVAVTELANGLAPLIGQFAAAGERGDVAVESIKRVGDMASFFGGSVQEASMAVQSFLSGSSVEPIRRYGVFASEAAVQAKALAMGLVQADVSSAQLASTQARLRDAQVKANEALKKYGAGSIEAEKAVAAVGLAEEALARVTDGRIPQLNEQQKIQARYAIWLEQTSQAQGDFARTSDSLANSQKRSTAELQNAAITLGEKLAPSAIKLMNAVSRLIDVFAKLPEPVQNSVIVLAAMAAIAGPMLKLITVMRSMWGVIAGLAARWGLVTTSANAAAVAQARAAAAGNAAGAASLAGRAGPMALLGKAGPALAVAAGIYGGAKVGEAWANTGSGKAVGDFINRIPVLGWLGYNTGKAIHSVTGIGPDSTGVKGPSFLAGGGTAKKPGWSWVGEEGPELQYIPQGASVVPSYESALLAAGGGTTNVNMTVQVIGKAYDERELARHLDAIARKAAATNTRTSRAIR